MTTATTTSSAFAWSPDAVSFQPDDVIPDALPLVAGTLAGRVDGDAVAVRVPYVQDAVAGFVAEAAQITESEPALAEVTIHTGKVAQLVAISREQWNQQSTTQRLATSVQRAIIRMSNKAFVSQAAPTAPSVTPPAGIANVTGVLEGDPVDGSLDALIDLVAQIEANEGNPSHILLSPTAWAAVRKFKEGAASNASLVGAGTEDAERRLLGLPLIVTPAITGLNGLVIDRAAVVVAAGPVTVASSEHARFAHDQILLRATWRFGANVVRPDRVGTFSVVDPD